MRAFYLQSMLTNLVIVAVLIALQRVGFPDWINTGLYLVAIWVGLSALKFGGYLWKEDNGFSNAVWNDEVVKIKAMSDAIEEGTYMNKDEVRRIIESTLKSGNKSPGLFDLPKIMGVKSKLESCNKISEVIGILEGNRGLLSKSFGLSDKLFDDGVESLKALAA